MWLPGCERQTLAERVELGGAVHESFEQLQLVGLFLSLVVDPCREECDADSRTARAPWISFVRR